MQNQNSKSMKKTDTNNKHSAEKPVENAKLL